MIFSVEHLSYERLREPVFLFRPKILSKKINFFLNNFNGKALYSVKTNPSRFVLESIYDLGLQSFDVASINEIKILKNLLPNAEVFFMNPIKPRRSISEAYFDYGVRNFSLDDNGELKKILEETNNATDLGSNAGRWKDLYISNDIDILNDGKILLGDGDDLHD